jgi:transcription antitermination factor NusG
MSYAVAICLPQRETKVAKDISDLGFSVFYPRVRSLAIRRGRRVYRTSPMFPRYLMVRMCDEIFDLSVDFLLGFIRTADRTLALVQDREIKNIQDRCSGDDIFTMPKNARFLPGELVRVKEGALAELLGKYESSSRNRELAAFMILGRSVICSFPKGELTAA